MIVWRLNQRYVSVDFINQKGKKLPKTILDFRKLPSWALVAEPWAIDEMSGKIYICGLSFNNGEKYDHSYS